MEILPLHAEIVRLESVDSTNAEALRRATAGAPEWTVIQARAQTAGRGRLDRKWYSPPGTGLYFSVILKPEDAVSLGVVPLAAGVSVVYALKEVCGVVARIKWPNDIQINGRKVCGILCETADAGKVIVVGIGINVDAWDGPLPDELLHRPVTTLEDESGRKSDRGKILQAFLDEFSMLGKIRSEHETQALIGRVRSEHEPFGARVKIVMAGKEFSGLSRGIDDEGRFVIEKEDGNIIKIVAGDVELLREEK